MESEKHISLFSVLPSLPAPFFQDKCLFTDSAMYVGFSSLVSFYIPLCLILFAYGKVFVIATRHSRGMRMGMKKVRFEVSALH